MHMHTHSVLFLNRLKISYASWSTWPGNNWCGDEQNKWLTYAHMIQQYPTNSAKVPTQGCRPKGPRTILSTTNLPCWCGVDPQLTPFWGIPFYHQDSSAFPAANKSWRMAGSNKAKSKVLLPEPWSLDILSAWRKPTCPFFQCNWPWLTKT